ncbi:hypothetical protein GCM10017673_41520 [Streptosporangium violaceochromogenes]|nr:hypothetical protein GCM10017673_41520 [Streptosporangium violaceochromogenes]
MERRGKVPMRHATAPPVHDRGAPGVTTGVTTGTVIGALISAVISTVIGALIGALIGTVIGDRRRDDGPGHPRPAPAGSPGMS